LVAAGKDELIERFSALEQRLVKASRYLIVRLRESLSQIQARPGFNQARNVLQQYIQRVDDLDYRLRISMGKHLRSAKENYNRLSMRLAALQPSKRLAEIRGRIALIQNKLEKVISEKVERGRHRLGMIVGKLDALSPLAVLSRGYALVGSRGGRAAPSQIIRGRIERSHRRGETR